MEVKKHLNNIVNVLNVFSMCSKANIVTLNMETYAYRHTDKHTHTEEEKCILIQEALRLYEI